MAVQLVGLTGGIATGKSTVARILATLGAPVIDADQVARAVVEPGSPALFAIVEAFGPSALRSDGSLDRSAMRSRITHDAAARRRLEAITHPAIRQAIVAEITRLAGEGHPAVVVEAALMVESGSYKMYPHLIVVSADRERQLDRLVRRDGMSPDDAGALISTQASTAEKEAVATHVIRNDGDLAELEAQTRATWAEITGR